MRIYRVYQSYHDSSESGTYEYGYFSDHERAKQRAKQIWASKNYEPYKPEDISEDGSIYVHDGWSSYHIRVEPIEVDKPTDHDNCGYT